MVWLSAVLWLGMETLLVMMMSDARSSSIRRRLGVSAALLIVTGHLGEKIVYGDLVPRRLCWLIMVWLLTEQWLWVETLLVMKLSEVR